MAYPSTTRNDFDTRTSATTAALADKATDFAAKASEQLSGAMDNAGATASAIAAQASEAGERVQEVAGNMKTALDRSVKEQPMATLAVAAVIGFVVGALWKS